MAGAGQGLYPQSFGRATRAKLDLWPPPECRVPFGKPQTRSMLEVPRGQVPFLASKISSYYMIFLLSVLLK